MLVSEVRVSVVISCFEVFRSWLLREFEQVIGV